MRCSTRKIGSEAAARNCVSVAEKTRPIARHGLPSLASERSVPGPAGAGEATTHRPRTFSVSGRHLPCCPPRPNSSPRLTGRQWDGPGRQARRTDRRQGGRSGPGRRPPPRELNQTSLPTTSTPRPHTHGGADGRRGRRPEGHRHPSGLREARPSPPQAACVLRRRPAPG